MKKIETEVSIAGKIPATIKVIAIDSKTENYLKHPKAEPRVYVWDRIANNPVLDLMSGYRFNRPYQWYRTWLAEVLDQVGIKFEGAGWSQRAGCSCGCSPGFILKGATLNGEHVQFDVHITLR